MSGTRKAPGKLKPANKKDPPWKVGNKPREMDGRSIPFAKKVIARALREQGLSTRQIAAKLGISHETARKVTNDPIGEIEAATVDGIKKAQSGKLAMVCSSVLEALQEPGVIESATFRDLMIGLGIGIEKQRLLDGESTSNVFSLVSLQMQADKVPAAPGSPALPAGKSPAALAESPEVIDVTPIPEGATVPRITDET